MDQPSNTDEAREAFMRHVFGDMMQLEMKLKETSLQLSASIENMRTTKISLSHETERLFFYALAEIDKSAKSISGSEHRIASGAAEAAQDILLRDNGPVEKLNHLTERLFLREREATKWLMKAMAQSEWRWRTASIAFFIGGCVGGMMTRYF